jgi:hypothetical protein
MSYPFNGNDAKRKITEYQLKKSQLDFRLVIRSEQTGQFFNTNIFCRSDELIEGNYVLILIFLSNSSLFFLIAEGVEWKKSSA